MSLRFGSGWLLIYFLICSCTFICSAPSCAHEIIGRLILLKRSHTLSPSRVHIPDVLSANLTLGLLPACPSPAHNPATSQNRTPGKSMRFHFCGARVYRYFADSSEAHALLC